MRRLNRQTILLIATVALVVAGLTLVNAGVQGVVASLDDRNDTVLVPGGSFNMGFAQGYEDEGPIHTVDLPSYRIDRTEVTNNQFADFVAATGHTTQAEKDGYCWAYVDGADDFQALSGAGWRHPQGPQSNIDGREDHPVVCVSWEDATAYADWAGKRLPTEAEWEYAARAGEGHHYRAADARFESAPSGGSPSAHRGANRHATDSASSPSAKSHHEGDHVATSDGKEATVVGNVWQGHWPDLNQLEDGYYYTAPVAQFEANPWGIHDTLGNVWEWTADWYASDYYHHSPTENPQGPTAGTTRVARGGSWFCSRNYCGAYSTHYRGASPPSHSFNNVGFRCAMDVENTNANLQIASNSGAAR